MRHVTSHCSLNSGINKAQTKGSCAWHIRVRTFQTKRNHNDSVRAVNDPCMSPVLVYYRTVQHVKLWNSYPVEYSITLLISRELVKLLEGSAALKVTDHMLQQSNSSTICHLLLTHNYPAAMETACMRQSLKFLGSPKIHLARSKGLSYFCWREGDEDKRHGKQQFCWFSGCWREWRAWALHDYWPLESFSSHVSLYWLE